MLENKNLFEQKHFNLTVVAHDDSSCCKEISLTSTSRLHRQLAYVFVNIADVNNNKPEFPQCGNYGAIAKLEEGQYKPNGPVIIKAKAIDGDSSLNGEVVYSLYYGRSESRKPFVIDSISGKLRPSPYALKLKIFFYNIILFN